MNHINRRTLFLQTNLKHKEVTIHINARALCKIKALANYKGSPIDLQPTTANGYFGTKVFCVPEELQIIEVYRGLYSPEQVKAWPRLMNQERCLFSLMVQNLRRKIEGGADRSPQLLFDKIAAAGVIVGDHAIAQISGAKATRKPQIITDELSKVIGIVKGIYGGNISYNKVLLPMLDDFRLTKHVIYVAGQPILEVFNAAEYELIPFVRKGNYRIGNNYVLLRFLMIDIWALRLLMVSGSISQAVLLKRINEILSQAQMLREAIAATDPKDLFQLKNYVGVVIKDTIAKKKLRSPSDNLSNYYPGIKHDMQTAINQSP